MYQVGFGDCFLVSFEYAKALADGRSERHVLIDFGSTHGPREFTLDTNTIAKHIQSHTSGSLDVIVVTHRHKDHLSAFGRDTIGKLLSELTPKLIVRPWTEDPTAPADARGLSRGFRTGLSAGEGFAEVLTGALAADARGFRGDLRTLADDQVPNQAAIDQLNTWAAQATATYVHAGSDSGIEALIPGISVSVLGPPTLEQWPEIAQQRAEDPDYWMLHKAILREGHAAALLNVDPEDTRSVATAEALISPGPVRWLTERLRDQHVHSLMRLVRILDDAMNNTSIILLFEIGATRLLFPGDAQIENWHYTLHQIPTDPDLQARLAHIGLYKVGHHGSRNATPRTLYKLWDTTTGAAQGSPMTALLSTRKDTHGETVATAVPRQTLVNALKRRATVYSTEDLTQTQPFVEVATNLDPSIGFVPIES